MNIIEDILDTYIKLKVKEKLEEIKQDLRNEIDGSLLIGQTETEKLRKIINKERL